MQEFLPGGKALHDIEIIGTTEETGTTIIFKPDDTIFSTIVYDYKTLATRLRDLAYLNAGITLTLTDKRELRRREQSQKRGILFGRRTERVRPLHRRRQRAPD